MSNSVICFWGLFLAFALNSTQIFGQATTESTIPNGNPVSRLDALQLQIETKAVERDQLRLTIKDADSSTATEVQAEIDLVNAEIKRLRNAFEQSAIGAVNIDVLAESHTKFDWREEVSQILQPIVENVKVLTEKPRRISRLQSIIEQNAIKKTAIDSAISAIQNKMQSTSNENTLSALAALEVNWRQRLLDNVDELLIAQQQLSELQNSDISWWETVSRALADFFKGRGLTLLIALVTAVVIWFVMRLILQLFQSSSKRLDKDEIRTRKRIAQYSYRLLTFMLILIGVISVFYTRGDVLLMGLSILAAAGIALGLRQAIPRFISEARLLLNIGDIREHERVMYNGLPWQVASLNVHSVLKNPELTGVVRLPLSNMASMISRPAGKEPWFPASRGDFILLNGDTLAEVMRLTPEIVELKDRSGTLISMPAPEFYTTTFKNLTRSESFGVTITFGIDYQHQSISLTEVPVKIKSAIKTAIDNFEHVDEVVDITVELEQAGASSLDYLVYVKMRPDAASSYLKIERLLQQTCVAVCTEEGWGIPFPHMTIEQISRT